MSEVNRKVQPAISSPGNIHLVDPETYFLENGVKVVQVDAGTQELVRVEMIFKAGSWYQSGNFISLATNLMLREGTRNHSSQEISDQLDFYGAHLETTAEKDSAYVTLYSLNKHLEKTLPILAELIREASFPAHEFAIFSAKQRQMLEVNMQKVNFMARTRFNALLYSKEHPYGNYLEVEDIGTVKVEKLKTFHTDFYHGGGCTIMVAGKIDPSMRKLLQRLFGDSSWIHPQPVLPVYSGIEAADRQAVIYRENALQSAIRMGCTLFNRQHSDYAGMKVLSTLLGGYFGSRLMTNLREDKGFTYGVGSAIIPLLNSGYFFISCEVGADVTAQAVEQIRFELTRLIEEKVSEKELTLVRNYMLGAFLRGIDGPFAMADTYRDVMEQGLDNEFYSIFLDTIRTITPSELRDLASRYLNPDRMHQLIVGKS